MSEADRVLVPRHFEEIWNRRDFAVADELMAENHLEHAVAPFEAIVAEGNMVAMLQLG